MKRNIIILMTVFSVACFSANANDKSLISTNDFATCSGEFKIDGRSYTITLHDVSWWTCVKFKVGSWFK